EWRSETSSRSTPTRRTTRARPRSWDEIGNFAVVWRSNGQDGSNYGIFGQLFDATGAPQASEFQVNSYTTGYQSYASAASSPDGDFVVVWGSATQDGSSAGVFGQRYSDLIFKDGFEGTG